MNCQNHPEIAATAYCRACGKPICGECRRDIFGTVYCAEHVPATAAAPPGAAPPPPPSPYSAPGPWAGPRTGISPALAFFLGLIPGVGAIYNGQYAKGLVHAVVWGVLMSITNSGEMHGAEPMFVMTVIAWWAYMAIEAHHTAQKLQRGEPVDEYSSLLNLRGCAGRFPVAGIALIVLGILLLLHTLDLFSFEYVARYWPVLLIAAGVYLLWARYSGHDAPQGEMRHER